MDLVKTHLGKNVDVTYQPRKVLEEALEKNPDDFLSYLLWFWDTNNGLVADVDKLDNKEYPEWSPKKVKDVLVDLYA